MWLTFSVTDSGIGINEAQQKLLFKPFSQADTSISRRFGGSGLGLVISQKFATLMGGKITCKSNPNQGSEFSFTLPFKRINIAKSQTTSISSKATNLSEKLSEAAKILSNIRVLLVEDTPLNQKVASEFLRKANLNVTIADNGKEAIELLGRHKFDIVLMDIQMPVMDGLEATTIIRQNPQFSDLPIIAVSAGVTMDEQEKYQTAGMNDFIAKPINPLEMLEKITQNLKLNSTKN
jgi:CheY-like chemotaxis protein